jgi:hypothetical protein
MDSKPFLFGHLCDPSCVYFAPLFLPSFFLLAAIAAVGALPDFFSNPAFFHTKKATNGTCLLDSLVAALDLGI